MSMTPERLAELDAVMMRAEKNGWAVDEDGDLVTRVPTCWREGSWQDGRGRNNAAAIVALHNAYPDLRAMIDAQAETIARLEAERVFVLGAGECVTNWGTYGGEPCVFLEPLVGDKGVQGEPVPDSEKHDPHLLRNGSVVLVLKGDPVAFLEDIATARAQGNADV